MLKSQTVLRLNSAVSKITKLTILTQPLSYLNPCCTLSNFLIYSNLHLSINDCCVFIEPGEDLESILSIQDFWVADSETRAVPIVSRQSGRVLYIQDFKTEGRQH